MKVAASSAMACHALDVAAAAAAAARRRRRPPRRPQRRRRRAAPRRACGRRARLARLAQPLLRRLHLLRHAAAQPPPPPPRRRRRRRRSARSSARAEEGGGVDELGAPQRSAGGRTRRGGGAAAPSSSAEMYRAPLHRLCRRLLREVLAHRERLEAATANCRRPQTSVNPKRLVPPQSRPPPPHEEPLADCGGGAGDRGGADEDSTGVGPRGVRSASAGRETEKATRRPPRRREGPARARHAAGSAACRSRGSGRALVAEREFAAWTAVDLRTMPLMVERLARGGEFARRSSPARWSRRRSPPLRREGVAAKIVPGSGGRRVPRERGGGGEAGGPGEAGGAPIPSAPLPNLTTCGAAEEFGRRTSGRSAAAMRPRPVTLTLRRRPSSASTGDGCCWRLTLPDRAADSRLAASPPAAGVAPNPPHEERRLAGRPAAPRLPHAAPGRRLARRPSAMPATWNTRRRPTAAAATPRLRRGARPGSASTASTRCRRFREYASGGPAFVKTPPKLRAPPSGAGRAHAAGARAQSRRPQLGARRAAVPSSPRRPSARDANGPRVAPTHHAAEPGATVPPRSRPLPARAARRSEQRARSAPRPRGAELVRSAGLGRRGARHLAALPPERLLPSAPSIEPRPGSRPGLAPRPHPDGGAA